MLVYSALGEDHANHLQQIFMVLQEHSFYVWKTKYVFVMKLLSYLGHLIVRAFLILTGYYRWFINRHAQIAALLTDLLKKEGFHWFNNAQGSFEALNVVLTTNPMLDFPKFNLPFVVETDACDINIGAVLFQEEHPLTFFNKKLSRLQQKTSTYSKELWAITNSKQKWRHNLLRNEFIPRPIIGHWKNCCLKPFSPRLTILPHQITWLLLHHWLQVREGWHHGWCFISVTPTFDRHWWEVHL